jgi:hypothetical protein
MLTEETKSAQIVFYTSPCFFFCKLLLYAQIVFMEVYTTILFSPRIYITRFLLGFALGSITLRFFTRIASLKFSVAFVFAYQVRITSQYFFKSTLFI